MSAESETGGVISGARKKSTKILYHFTALAHLKSIQRDGLTRGGVWTSPNDGLNGVWLTARNTSSGNGNPVETVAGWWGKGDVRITVTIPRSDSCLFRWSRWGRKHCTPEWFDTLNDAGSHWRDWYIYFNLIPPEQFKAVDILNPDAPREFPRENISMMPPLTSAFRRVGG